ncbi:MAG: helix-turn-helix domain-containing protein [Anaerolineae bacterium]
MDSQEYLTPKEVAQLLKVHEETIRRYLRSGELPAVKLRGVYRVKREDLDEFLKKHRTL